MPPGSATGSHKSGLKVTDCRGDRGEVGHGVNWDTPCILKNIQPISNGVVSIKRCS